MRVREMRKAEEARRKVQGRRINARIVRDMEQDDSSEAEEARQDLQGRRSKCIQGDIVLTFLRT